MNIAIVFAKGPEKGERNINLYLIENHPVIYYSISAALSAKRINKVFVATDDKKIAEIAEGLSCEVIKRPKELKTMGEAIVYSAREAIKKNPSCKNLIILSGNNSMVSPYLIEKSIDALEKRKYFLKSTKARFPPICLNDKKRIPGAIFGKRHQRRHLFL
ncbi:hypothetical protein ES705_10976 [subsurface metagenome]